MSESTGCRVVVLISGSGSNLQAIIDKCKTDKIDATICAVISNKSKAFGLERAENAGITTAIVDHKAYQNREDFDDALKETIDQFEPELVVLAGFMRILTAGFIRHYLGRIINIHPSLLPKYPGLNTHQRAIDADDKTHGTTVHFATEELDGGPPILQASVNINSDDSVETLAARVLIEEHKIYPRVIDWFAQGRLVLEDNHAWLDGEKIAPTGIHYKE